MPAEPAYWDQDVLTADLPPIDESLLHMDRQPYFGRVGYVYGGAIDRPLAVMRANYADHDWLFPEYANSKPIHWFAPFTLYPQWDVRGEPALGSTKDGGLRPCEGSGPGQRCVAPMAWSRMWVTQGGTSAVLLSRAWAGSLVQDKRDGTGLQYRRNRYLDPVTGRFTQPDPIGLGGGLNSYGYASGDPVNFSDPFGLAPQWVFNQYGEKIGNKGGANQHYLIYGGQEYTLDRAIVSNSSRSPYVIHGEGDAPKVATGMANSEPRRSRAVAGFQSRHGGALDFKRKGELANPRQLFLMGNEAVHTDIVGNMAWGYFVRKKLGLTLDEALTWADRFSFGRDDPRDRRAIRDSYLLP